MIEERNAVTLSVNGLDYAGWKKVQISAGIERQARDFSLSITWQWPGQAVAMPIRQGDRCEVRIGGELVLTGWVFAAPVSYDAGQVTQGVSGRSLTADLIDCAAINTPGQWRGQSAQHVIRALAEPYGLEVVSEIAETAQISDHSIEPGEKVFESIDRLLTLLRVFSTDDARGRVVLAKPGSAGRAADVLELGRNLLSADARLDFSGVFSEYRCIGQQSGSDEQSGSAASEVAASAADASVGRRRVLVINESGQMTAELAAARVNWERANRLSKALAVTYKVQGWRQSTGALWRHNMIVRVIDPVLGFDRDMLISEIAYSLDDQGTVATLTVAPPEGFEPEPADPHNARKLKKGGKADNFEYLLPADWDKP